MLKVLPDSPSLEELLEHAGDPGAVPLEPEGGIPRQWLPGWIRWPIRVLVLPGILLDLSMQRVARWIIRPPFKRVGTCLKRGNCCHYILVPEPKGLLAKIFWVWNTQILGFYPRSKTVHETEGKRVRVMGCRYLGKNGSCTQYRLRPTACRKWPLIEYFGYPRILKGCGFEAVDRK
jgi:hypothetical protein